jgi:DNA polymerase
MKRATQARRPTSGIPLRATRARRTSTRDAKTSPDAPVPAPATRGKPECAATGSAADFLPPKMELPVLREASRGCRGCPLYCNATQTVFGEGPAHATVMFVGEQPGDQEDLAGRPFVGPSGHLLDEALQEAGVPRDDCYVTNAVKHFKFEPRGKRRIHSKPSAREVAACRPWLEAEIQLVRPTMIVCLGATAAQSLLGRDFRVTQHRGEVLKSEWAPSMLATVHPSSLLRVPDPEMRREARRQFVDDMKVVARQIRKEAR